MPGNQTRTEGVSPGSSVRNDDYRPATNRQEKAKIFGRLGSLPVRDVPVPAGIEQVDAPPAHPRRSFGTAREWRNAANAVLSGEGGSARIEKKDSAGTIVKKIGGIASSAFVVSNGNARVATARIASAINSLSKLKLIHVNDWYNKDVMTTAIAPIGIVAAVGSSVVLAKRSYDAVHEIAADIDRHQERQATQALLKEFNPITYKFRARSGYASVSDDTYQKNKLAALMAKKNTWNTSEGGNIWRSSGQRALDVLAKMKDIGVSAPASTVGTFLPIFATAGTAAALAGTGIGAVGHTLIAVNNFAKMGVQMSAMANIESERQKALERIDTFKMAHGRVKEAPVDDLLVGISNRMIQERTYASRLLFWSGCSFAMSGAATIAGMVTGGVGVIASSLISGLAIMLSGGVSLAFNTWHSKKLANRRADNATEYQATKEVIKAMTPKARAQYFKTLDANDKIGLLERYLLDTFRTGDTAEAQQVYDFLIGCGISENTVKAMAIVPENEAMAMLQTQLYSARTRAYPKNMKYLPKVAGYMSGVTYLSRAIQKHRETARGTPHEPVITAPAQPFGRYALSSSAEGYGAA